MMAAIIDFGPKLFFLPWEVLGERFLLWYTSNEFISDEKALLILLSNLNRCSFVNWEYSGSLM